MSRNDEDSKAVAVVADNKQGKRPQCAENEWLKPCSSGAISNLGEAAFANADDVPGF